MFVKIVDDDLRIGVALQLDHDARALVRLIADVADIRQNFFVHQLCDPLDQRGAIHIVRNLGDDDLFFSAFELFHAGFTAHLHAAAAGLEVLFYAANPADGATGGEIRSFHMLHQVVKRDVGIVDLRADSIDHLNEIVRWNICRHSNGDTRAAVNEQVRKRRRKNRWFGARFVIVRDKIDRVLLHVGHERGAEMRHARLGVTHGCGRIAFDRTEIALAIDQPLAHRPWLGHVHESGVDYRFAVGMIITARIAADFRAFTVLPPRKKRQIMHRVENPSLGRLQSIARIRQRARNDHRHRVIEKRPRHFLGHIDRLNFFVWV